MRSAQTDASLQDAEISRPSVSGIDVVTTLAHFAIITYTVPAEILRPMIPERFELELIDTDHGPRALMSVVPFEDRDFRFAALPFAKLRFGQTNYRSRLLSAAQNPLAAKLLGDLLMRSQPARLYIGTSSFDLLADVEVIDHVLQIAVVRHRVEHCPCCVLGSLHAVRLARGSECHARTGRKPQMPCPLGQQFTC